MRIVDRELKLIPAQSGLHAVPLLCVPFRKTQTHFQKPLYDTIGLALTTAVKSFGVVMNKSVDPLNYLFS